MPSLRRIAVGVATVVIVFVAAPYVIAPFYRFVDPVSMPMLWRWTIGARVERVWVPLDRISPALPLAVIALEQGFEAPDFAIVGEQDILGDRLVRQSKRRRRAQDVLAEASALTTGDLVVHIEHGVGRFVGLKTIEAAGAPHDCLEIHYAGGDRLFLPVENLELLSRYGSETGELDKLGGAGWQSRKARLKFTVMPLFCEERTARILVSEKDWIISHVSSFDALSETITSSSTPS